jgi:hypothetical protein
MLSTTVSVPAFASATTPIRWFGRAEISSDIRKFFTRTAQAHEFSKGTPHGQVRKVGIQMVSSA